LIIKIRRQEMEIKYLCDHLIYADTVAKWNYDEFVKGIKVDRTYESTLSSIKNCRKLEFPIRLVAIIDNKCVGTVSIVFNDLKCRDYTPWLASLYVEKAYRKQKIGQKLINHVKKIAAELGYGELYLRTEHASDYYRKLGWEFVESCEDDYNLKPDVFKCKII